MTESAMSGLGSKRERCLTWTRSSRSTLENNCVEVRFCTRVVQVRDSKQAAGPRLSFCGTAWWSLLLHVVASEGVSTKSTGTFVTRDSPC